MLRVALGYLAVAIVVAIGVSSLPGSERAERGVASRATHGAKSDNSARANQDEENDESTWETTRRLRRRGTWEDDQSAWEDESPIDDEGYAEEDGESARR